MVKCHLLEDCLSEALLIEIKEYAIIGLEDLNIFEEGTEVTPELLIENGIIKKTLDGVKLLANGELEKKLTIRVHKASKTAAEKVEAAGGKVEVI